MDQSRSAASAAYIAKLSAQLKHMAETANLATLAYLLAMVCQEANNLRKAVPTGRSTKARVKKVA